MDTSIIRSLVIIGLMINVAPQAMAKPLKSNPVVGVFTVTPLTTAMIADQGFIESGAGFLFEDGSAVGYDQITIAPQTQVPLGEVEDFLSQDGVLPLAADIDFQFASWELRENGTVTLSGTATTLTPEGAAQFEQWGLTSPYSGRFLGGFIFSADPVERDLIGGDGIADHVEYIATEPDGQLISDVADFLVANDILSHGKARVIEVSMTDHPPQISAVPEPSSLLLVLVGMLGMFSKFRGRAQ